MTVDFGIMEFRPNMAPSLEIAGPAPCRGGMRIRRIQRAGIIASSRRYEVDLVWRFEFLKQEL